MYLDKWHLYQHDMVDDIFCEEAAHSLTLAIRYNIWKYRLCSKICLFELNLLVLKRWCRKWYLLIDGIFILLWKTFFFEQYQLQCELEWRFRRWRRRLVVRYRIRSNTMYSLLKYRKLHQWQPNNVVYIIQSIASITVKRELCASYIDLLPNLNPIFMNFD